MDTRITTPKPSIPSISSIPSKAIPSRKGKPIHTTPAAPIVTVPIINNDTINGRLIPLDESKYPFATGNWTNSYSDDNNVYYVFSDKEAASITLTENCYVGYLLVGGGQAGGWAGRVGWTDAAQGGQGWLSWFYNGSYGNCGEVESDYIDVSAGTKINVKVGKGGKSIPYKSKYMDKSHGAGLVTLSCHDIYHYIQHGPLDEQNTAVANLLNKEFNKEGQFGGKGEDTVLFSSNFSDRIVAKGGDGDGSNLNQLQKTVRWIYNTIATFSENNQTLITAPAYTDFQTNIMKNINYGFGGKGGVSVFDSKCDVVHNQPLAQCNVNYFGNNNNEFLKVNITANGENGNQGIAILWVNIEECLYSSINKIDVMTADYVNNKIPGTANNYNTALLDEQSKENDYKSKYSLYDNLQSKLKFLANTQSDWEKRRQTYQSTKDQYITEIAAEEAIISDKNTILNIDKNINKTKKEKLYAMIENENMKLKMYYNDLAEKLVGYDRKNDFESENADYYKKVYFYMLYLYYIVLIVFFFFLITTTPNLSLMWKAVIMIICLLYPLFIYRIQYSIYDSLFYFKSILFATPYTPAKKLDYNATEAYEAYLYLKSLFSAFTGSNSQPQPQDNY